MDISQLQAKFAGALFGTFIGDAMGSPLEGRPPENVAGVWQKYGPVGLLRACGGRYTDDTQMMIGVAESLVACKGFDPKDMARRFAGNFEDHRGYGWGAIRVLTAIRSGTPWDQAATIVFPDGSFGNGAAMRIAPVGVYYHDDPVELRRVAEGSANITHAHPVAREGAAMMAYAVSCAMNLDVQAKFEAMAFLQQLKAFVRPDCDIFQKKLAAMEDLLNRSPDIAEVVETLGNNITINESVPAAIYAFLSHPKRFEDAVAYAIQLGGDTDTIGAMAGAIAGAFHGVNAIPPEWIDLLDDNGKGRSYVRNLAGQLFESYRERR